MTDRRDVLTTAIPEVIHRRGMPVWCLGTTKDGHPRHPLYVHGDQPRIRFVGTVRP